jgi:hypothetical protein
MPKIDIDLERIKKEDGNYDYNAVKELERATGKPWKELHAELEQPDKPDVPEGNPQTWDRKTKLEFIAENGYSAFKERVNGKA